MATRRLPGEASIYKRASDGRWIAAVDLGWQNGRRKRRTVSALTKRAVATKLRDLRRELDAGISTGPITVEQWMTTWLDDISDARPHTKDGYRGYVRTWIGPHLGAHRLDKLRPDHIRGMLAAMAAVGRAPATQKQAYAILNAALRQAVRDRRIGYNPADSVTPPKVPKNGHPRLSLEDARTVLSSLDGNPWASRWVAALLAGLRQGEALGLTWDKVDLDAGYLIVDQAIQEVKGQGLQVVAPKSKSSLRVVPLVPPLVTAMRALPHREGYVWGVKAGDVHSVGGDRPQNPRRDWGLWSGTLAAAGVRHIPLHGARATTGSLLMEAGVHASIIAQILGHAQVQTTEGHYLRGDDRVRREAMAALDALLELPAPPA